MVICINFYIELARQEIVVSRFLRAARDFYSARRRFLRESLRKAEKRKCKTRLWASG